MLTHSLVEQDSARPDAVERNPLKPVCHYCSCYLQCMAHQLTAGDMAQFAAALIRPADWERARHLFHMGDDFHSLYLVRSGSVKVYTIDNEGGEHVLGFYLPGDVIGMDAIAGGRHDCAAITMETSQLCVLAFDRLQQLSATLGSLQQPLNALYAREIAREHAVVRLLSKRNAEQRLTGFLLHLSRRLDELGHSAYEFNLSMSRHEIGNHLGLALETVSRLFTRLTQDGVVQIKRRRVRVRNLALLEALAGESVTRQTGQQTARQACPHYH